MKRALLILALALPVAAQQRLASDFEIAQMEKQLAGARTINARFSGHLNLGDVRAARNERTLADAEYRKVLALADGERLAARRESNLTRYAYAATYAGLAHAKLRDTARAFEMLEEAARYASHDADGWNVYASAMRVLGMPRKAAGAARNAVAIAIANDDKPIDIAVYRYTLASALLEAKEDDEAEPLLVELTNALRSDEFASMKREAARSEAFEVYSSVRSDVAAYVSLLNRSQLQLAALYEDRGDLDKARVQYQRVLESRNDDVTALNALARLATSDEERERRYAEAFDANPFSLALIREYRMHLRGETPSSIDESTTGGKVRKALVQLDRGEWRAARATLDALLKKFPDNGTLRALREETELIRTPILPGANPDPHQLRTLLETFERLTPEQRVQLDKTTFTSDVEFSDAKVVNMRTTFESGTIGTVPFRFSEPTAFNGAFGRNVRLKYRILGVTRSGDADAFLLEPLGVEARP